MCGFQSDDIAELAAALAAAQGELDGAGKNAQNPHLKNRYADISAVWAAVRPVLPRHGLAVVQTMRDASDGRAHVVTMLLHKSGQWISGECVLPVPKNDPQGFGSAITYARRYSLSAILGVVSEEDDDGDGAKKKDKASDRRTPPSPAPKHQTLDLATIRVALDAIGVEAELVPYLSSLAIPKDHPDRPAVITMYEARRKTLAITGDVPPTNTTAPQPMTDPQRKAIMAHYKGATRDARLKDMGSFLGRRVESFNELTRDEASAFLEDIKEKANA